MPDEPQPGPDDDFQEMLRKLLSGEGQIDPSQLAGAAGLPNDPAAVAELMSQLQRAAQTGADGIDFTVTADRAAAIARDGAEPLDPATVQASTQAFQVAALWLDEVTSVAELTAAPSVYTREQWAKATAPVWSQIAEPVASSIAAALTEAIDQRAPEELKAMLDDVSKAMRGVGGALFAIQLGQVVGQLAKEVVSGGDVGVPLLDEQVAALVPQNVAEFADGLDVPGDAGRRPRAAPPPPHARLFRSARWLRLHIITSITEYAKGVHIPFDRVEESLSGIDPTDQEQLRDALASGALIPPRTPEQDAALARLETMLALVEGWVDTVTAAATARLPRAGAIAEMVRRRRAAGGPAESAFATLVGLELRPRRLREAAAMWQHVTDGLGADQRDALWAAFDLVPGSDDIDAPEALVARLRDPSQSAEDDAFDRALEDLLNDATDDRPHEDEAGGIDEGSGTDDADDADGSTGGGPAGGPSDGPSRPPQQ
jgi:putative hydrolase